MSFLTKIRNAFFPQRLNHDIQQELETHQALLEEEVRNAGLTPEEAQAEVRRRFGSSSKHFENTREANLFAYVSELRQDARFAIRQMRKTPGFTLVALTVMG